MISIPEPGNLASCLPSNAATKRNLVKGRLRSHYAKEEERASGARSSEHKTYTYVYFYDLSSEQKGRGEKSNFVCISNNWKDKCAHNITA